jgi:hypothetical protein
VFHHEIYTTYRTFKKSTSYFFVEERHFLGQKTRLFQSPFWPFSKYTRGQMRVEKFLICFFNFSVHTKSDNLTKKPDFDQNLVP